MTELRPQRTYGRSRSRTLKPRQASLLETLLPRLALPDCPFDPRALALASQIWLEIGFGGGEHFAAQAVRRPDVLFLGAEAYLNGVASALRHVEAAGLANVRLHLGDGRDLKARMPDGCLDRLYLLFPDPWPKARHHKRRLVTAAFVDEAGRLLRPGGMVRFATDWADYAEDVLARFIAHPAFAWTAESARDWREPPADHVVTRYQEKRLGDSAPIWLEFARR